MARKPASKKRSAKAKRAKPGILNRILGWLGRVILTGVAAIAVSVAIFGFVRPPTTPTILSESLRLGDVQRQWVPMERIAPVVARSVVAAEDANFCLHWGIDMAALRLAIEEGAERGASTLTQQVVKNVWLWQGRSWPRKAFEAAMTPVVEALWTKKRIVEIYLNVAEFDTGVFGVEAAARHHFGVSASELSSRQAALLAAVLPNPKERQAVNPSTFVQRRASAIQDGAATIAADGRARCFED